MTAAEQTRLEKYEKIFKKGWPSEPELAQQIESWRQKAEKEQELPINQRNEEELRRQIERGRRRKRTADIFLFLAATVFLAMIGLAFWQPLPAGIGAVVSAAVILFCFSQRKHDLLKDQEQEYFLIKRQIENEKKAIALAEAAAAEFFTCYGLPYQAAKMPTLLYEWAQYRREYEALTAKKQEMENVSLRDKLQEKLERRAAFLAAYQIEEKAGEGGEKECGRHRKDESRGFFRLRTSI